MIVINADTLAHTVNLNCTQIDVDVLSGAQSMFAAGSSPGSYPLACYFHKNMHGMLSVAT